MNFINHTTTSSLDSGDALECIDVGVQYASAVLTLFESAQLGVNQKRNMETAMEWLRAWRDAARDLSKATNP